MNDVAEGREALLTEPTLLYIHHVYTPFHGDSALLPSSLRNGPDKNDSNNGNKHVGMQKRC